MSARPSRFLLGSRLGRTGLLSPKGCEMKNVYDSHPRMNDSGEFWRCEHGRTGFGEGFRRKGCFKCAIWRPKAALAAWWNRRLAAS
jgi:hypothetical protein